MTWFSFHRRSASRFVSFALCAAIVVTVTAMAGCGETSKTPKAAKTSTSEVDSSNGSPSAKGAVGDATGGDSSQRTPTSAEKSTAETIAVLDDVVRKPATVEEAQRALDLTKFPLPEGAQLARRSIAHVQYRAFGDLKPVFDYPRKELENQGWKWTVSPRTRIDETTAYGTFAKDGFCISVTLFAYDTPAEPNGRGISITNWGNINLSKLPHPPGAKLKDSFPTEIFYATDQSPAETITAVRELLTAQGWEPYDHPDGPQYKQNAILLTANVYSKDGKTNFSYGGVQMSADLPPPPELLDVTYNEHTGPLKELMFETAVNQADLYRFYREKLAQSGWKATTDNPIIDEPTALMIFRNPAKDMLTLKTRENVSKTIRGTLTHQSAEERAEIERKLEQEDAAAKND